MDRNSIQDVLRIRNKLVAPDFRKDLIARSQQAQLVMSTVSKTDFVQLRKSINKSLKLINNAEFRRILFSNELLDEFVKHSNFSRNEIEKAIYAMRNSFVESFRVPSSESRYPVKKIETKKEKYEFDESINKSIKESVNHNFIHPFSVFLKGVSSSSATGVTTTTLIRATFNECPNYFVFSAILTTLLTCYIIAHLIELNYKKNE